MPKIASVYDLIRNKYGIDLAIEENPLTSTLGTEDTIIAHNNPRRLGLIVINLSTNILYLRPMAPASATSGIALSPSGGYFALAPDDDFHLASLEWHAVASDVDSSIYTLGILIR